MHPVIEAFGLTIRSYSLFAAIAALTCAAMVFQPLLRVGFTRRGAAVLLLCTCAAFLIGARLWNVAVNPGAFGPDRPWYVLRMTGFSLYGGILGALAAVYLCCRASRVPVRPVLDAFVVPFAVAFCLSRVGCFLNGCCAGVKTNRLWGVVFPSELDGLKTSFFTLKSAPVHPTQLYELGLALLGVPFCLYLAKRIRTGEGGRAFLYGAWFCLLRLAVLPLRSLPYPAVVVSVLYPLLYLGLAVLAFCLLFRDLRSQK